MRLRPLEIKDAEGMLEWMHDSNVCEFMQRDFASMTIDNCKGFIESSRDMSEDMHLAAVNDDDEYMGTVSLKHIDRDAGTAEFAITFRRCAMGTGISAFAMKEIIKKGLCELGLDSVIWCVSRENLRANRFYEKNGYKKMECVPDKYKLLYPEWESMNWFEVKKGE